MATSIHARLAAVTIGCLPLLGQAACVHQSTVYRIIDLGMLKCPNGHCTVGGVNDVCEVAGYDEDQAGSFAFLLRPNAAGVWTQVRLPAPALQYNAPGWQARTGTAATSFQAFNVNVSGEVIGVGRGPRNEAILWRTRDQPDPLGMNQVMPQPPAVVGAYLGGLPNNGFVSEGLGINNLHQVVGDSKNQVPTHAFQWEKASGSVDLGLLANHTPNSFAKHINDSGYVVGDAVITLPSGATTTHAVLWDATTHAMTDLGVLPGGQNVSHATAVLQNGNFGPLVVGTSSVTSGNHAFRWMASTGIQDLKDLPGGGEDSGANAIAGPGGVFGYGTTAAGRRAVGWPLMDLVGAPATTPIDLNPLTAANAAIGTFVLEEAKGVNTFGMISVIGTAGGSKHAFLLIPNIDDTPLPYSGTLFGDACIRGAAK